MLRGGMKMLEMTIRSQNQESEMLLVHSFQYKVLQCNSWLLPSVVLEKRGRRVFLFFGCGNHLSPLLTSSSKLKAPQHGGHLEKTKDWERWGEQERDFPRNDDHDDAPFVRLQGLGTGSEIFGCFRQISPEAASWRSIWIQPLSVWLCVHEITVVGGQGTQGLLCCTIRIQYCLKMWINDQTFKYEGQRFSTQTKYPGNGSLKVRWLKT